MPLVESAGPGLTPGPLAFSATASCRKEKKKQAKEERDRLKQAEKKKRRLEKALATAAAIRAELEKKKQRRKEEERRLDEEGAALAEAVALQVLVDEESDELGKMGVATEGDSQSGGVGERRCLERMGDKTESKAACFSVRNTEPVHHHNGLKRHGSFKYSPGSDGNKRETKEWNWNEWDACSEGQEVSLRYDGGVEGEVLEGQAEGTWEFYSCAEETVKTSNERAQAAEAAAGLAAAQAVAALQIAEEARARAQAAKTAAEEAMNEALDHHHTHQKSEYLNQTSITAQCVEKERDELKGQLQETERKLHEKTCRVVELEHNLEEVTRYLLEFKAMVEGAKHCTQAMSDATRHDETGSEEGNA
ncbi:unnamed protein product [Sphagnum troendelagicum]|uniref:Uncharacterized protein n=1 Tax=Sphagnum troendelagicum TaxID=128251 RepID=A0ABP0TL12_9BRYO